MSDYHPGCGCNAGGMCDCEWRDGAWYFSDGRVHPRYAVEVELRTRIAKAIEWTRDDSSYASVVNILEGREPHDDGD